MEVDPETWPLMESLISHVWVSENLPFLEAEESPDISALPSTTGTENARPEPAESLESNLEAPRSAVRISLSVDLEFT